ncbi:MAG: replicative DNA helicase [Phycisphaerae bacterium]
MSKAPSPENRETPRPSSRATDRSSAFDRVLPHSPDAERALLGSMLQEHAAIGEAIAALGDAARSAFFFERHQKLYDHIVSLYDDARPIDGVVIKDELIRKGQFESLGGYEFLAELINSVPSSLRVREYARIVREKHVLRELIRATHRVMEIAFDEKSPAQAILDEAEREIFNVTERRVSGGPIALPELVREEFTRIEQRGEDVLTGEPTGYFALDEMTCGLQRSELIIVAGRPSMGKTAFGLNLAEHMALDANRPVLFFSLEMSRQQVAQRILCSRARVDSHRLRRGRISDRELDLLKQAADEIAGKPLYVDDAGSLSVLELRARARMAYRKLGIRAVLVDYLQLARAPGAESRQVEVAEISRGLKALAKELEIPVVAMAQLNRNPEDRSGNRPRMSDLRESGAIEQDADMIMLLHRESYYKAAEEVSDDEAAQALLIIAKQRNGPVGDVELHFNRSLTRFDNPQVGGRYADYREAQAAPAPSAPF